MFELVRGRPLGGQQQQEERDGKEDRIAHLRRQHV
jgi:hypothetical protein